MKSFAAKNALSMESRCARLLERHRDTVRVQKPHVAVANLVRIIEATLSLSNRRGFDATTLRDLAGASGLSMGALYSYFDSKDTLLLMILGEVTSAVNEILGSPPDEVLDRPHERLHWLIRTHVFMTESMLQWFVFAYLEAKTFPKAAREIATNSELQTEKMIADTLEDGAAKGLFVVGDPLMTAALIKPLLQDWYIKRGKYRRRGIAPEQYAELVCNFVDSAIKARQPEPAN